MTLGGPPTFPARGGVRLRAGRCRLWLELNILRSTSDFHGDGRSVLDGRFVTLDYDWTDLDGPHVGGMLIGRTVQGMWQMDWIDT